MSNQFVKGKSKDPKPLVEKLVRPFRAEDNGRGLVRGRCPRLRLVEAFGLVDGESGQAESQEFQIQDFRFERRTAAAPSLPRWRVISRALAACAWEAGWMSDVQDERDPPPYVGGYKGTALVRGRCPRPRLVEAFGL